MVIRLRPVQAQVAAREANNQAPLRPPGKHACDGDGTGSRAARHGLSRAPLPDANRRIIGRVDVHKFRVRPPGEERMRFNLGAKSKHEVVRTRPWSYTYLATQRMPLPHISASLPSALNMRMRASALSDGQMRIKPSEPTPQCRSLITRLSPAGSCGIGSRKQST